MAVTFHNATVTAGGASVGSRTILHTVSAAGAAVLVFTYTNASTSISAVGANGVSFSRLGAISASSGRAEVWGLSAFPGSATLSISINTVAASLMFATVVVSYVGQRTIGGSPFGTVVAGTAQGAANNAFSVSSTSTDLVVYGFGVSGAPAVTITTGNNRGSATASTVARLVVGDVAGAATVSISATAATANTFAFLAVPVVASAAEVTAIAFDNAAFTGTNTNALSIGMKVTATSNACLVVFTMQSGTGPQTLSAVLAGGNPMTLMTAVAWNGGVRVSELWVLTAAPTGIVTISCAAQNTFVGAMAVAAATYVGIRATATPFGGIAFGSAASVATATLSLSTTLGNKAVFGFTYDFTPGVASAGPGLTQRVNPSTNWPSVLIADAPGNSAVTGMAIGSANVATNWGFIGLNLIAAVTSGIAAFTDTRDIFSASGTAVSSFVTGRLSATDARDTFSASGQVIVQGRLSATDVTDKFSAPGRVIVQGLLSATDVRDVFSATGRVLVVGRLSATDARDTFLASGQVIVSARLSATDARDIFSASGTNITGNVSAIAAFTDARDLFSASGQIIVQGLVNFTDRPDTFSASGTTVQSAAAIVVVQQDSGSGGGHGKRQTEYFRADPAFWSLREQYLKRIHKDISAEPEVVLIDVPVTASIAAPASTPIDPGPLAALRASRVRTIEAIPSATNMRQLRYHGARLRTLNDRIAEEKRRIAIAEKLAWIAARPARKAERAHAIRKAKRKITMLAATRAVAALSYVISNP